MDKQYGSPREVANATFDDLLKALRRVLRNLDGSAEFLYQAEFEYANGRKAPLLMIGGLRGAWRDYMRRNAASTRFASGTCQVLHEDGRALLELRRERGRGGGAAHTRIINNEVLRKLGASARFIETTVAPAAPSAAPRDAKAGTSPVADAGTILADFNTFKAAPTMERLEALVAAVEAWKAAAPGAPPDPRAPQIEKLATLLAEKGRAYVQAKRGT